ncbi:hypothetical protein DNFV4_00676 [Nitrospira tepida]|uniref:Uncharacterized protein n=1 Tax=Nitrospira tepida TaxID=2973512 RepID=A0AA86T9C7_9BACT|nr:hypothetical protein [Nitrospira tepida]CAI4030248.1 hypothetical protein DNFV4_00676 [Nitrospira tepida]
MKILALGTYLTGIWLLLGAFCLAPMEALALQTTQYARVVAQAERIAYLAAKKSDLAAKVATAAVAATPTSTAIRLVAGPLGWAALGVSAGLVIAQIYYSPSDLQTIKQAATPAGSWTITLPTTGPFVVPGPAYNSQQATVSQTIVFPCLGDGNIYDWMVGPYPDLSQSFYQGPPVGAVRVGSNGYYACHFAGQAGTVEANPGTPTEAGIQQYVASLPASDPQSVESHSTGVGVGQTPQSADTVESQPVSPTEMPTQVKQKPVPAGDSVVADNVPPPSGTQQQTTGQQQTTTTTTTTENPDGSTTTQEDTETTVSCLGGAHDSRTFGTVLVEHQAIWNSSGLLAAVNLLKTLTWPSTLPVINLPSSFFGSQAVDFNHWAWFFTALRTLVIAGASLMAYRIIFVGGR